MEKQGLKIGLIDVDGHNYPNLALMKISSYHKKQGNHVEWYEPLWGGVSVVYSLCKDLRSAKVQEDKANTLVNTDYKDPPIVNENYLVRRLMPTECARLQGFPDYWCSDLDSNDEQIEEELPFWREVFDTYAEIMGTKPRSDNQIKKWLKNPHTDSAEYKMWGNGVALPCVVRVMAGIERHGKEDNATNTRTI